MLNYSIFYKICQEVNTIAKLMLLGTPNSVDEKQILNVMDAELKELDREEQNNPKSPVNHFNKREWVKYAITKEYPLEMPWEGTKEKKQKLGTSRAQLVYIIQVYQPDYEQVRTLLHIVKQKKIWRRHWGKAAFMVEQAEADSPPREKTRYIQMVQAHGLVQLSMGAAQIGGVVDTNTPFTLHLTPDAENKLREPTITLVKEVFAMMEVKKKKVWICLSKNTNGSFTGYFSSVVAEIKDYVQNFITCPMARVFWWLRCRGCLTYDVNRMTQYCITLEQQKRVTRSKYLSTKGYVVLTEEDLDDIINAIFRDGIYDMTLGLLDRERRELVTNNAYDANAISFGEAKEGVMEVYNFSSSVLIIMIHSKNRMKKSVATTKTLAQSLFSIETGTSKVMDGDDKDKDSNAETGKDDNQDGKGAIAIKGMDIMNRGTEQKGGEAETLCTDLDSATKAAKSNALSSAMRKATDNLKLSLDLDGTNRTGETTKDAKHVDPYTDDKEGEAYITVEESVGEDSDMNISGDYESNVTEVSPEDSRPPSLRNTKIPKTSNKNRGTMRVCHRKA
jgi:hypothetical protein